MKIPNSDVIISLSEKIAQFQVALLVSQPSLSRYTLNLEVGPTSSPELVLFLKLICSCEYGIVSVTLWIMW